MKPDFKTAVFQAELTAFVMANRDNMARAKREADFIGEAIASEQNVHRQLNALEAAFDQTDRLKASIVARLSTHRTPRAIPAPPIEQRHSLTHEINKIRGKVTA
jgi:hypothetical protein